MPGLPTELYNRCRTTLLKCTEFDTNTALRAVFVTDELHPFRDRLSSAASKSARVDACLAFLADKRLSDGRPVLPLFLATLRDRYQPGDALRDELDTLAQAIDALSRRQHTVQCAVSDFEVYLSEFFPEKAQRFIVERYRPGEWIVSWYDETQGYFGYEDRDWELKALRDEPHSRDKKWIEPEPIGVATVRARPIGHGRLQVTANTEGHHPAFADEFWRLFESGINKLLEVSKGEGEPPGPAPPLGTGNRWAVLVGVNKYQNQANYGRLQVCVKDVAAIRERLVAAGFDPARIRLLTDHTPELPTKGNILVALKAIAEATEPDDLLLFYYSGHGDESGGESYLVARDGQKLVLGDTAVPLSRVREIVEEAPARAKVIVLDACHSGADIGGKGPQPMSAQFIRRVFGEAEGLAVLASCKQDQLSYEWRAEERSVFTHYLLEALTGAADRDQKGFVTVQDASRHVTDGVKLWASQRNTSQTPTLHYTVAGDIILADYR